MERNKSKKLKEKKYLDRFIRLNVYSREFAAALFPFVNLWLYRASKSLYELERAIKSLREPLELLRAI